MSVFFIDRAASLLAPGGRLCFIVPDKWVDVQYGESLKAYLLQEFVIEYLIWVERKVFKEDVDSFIMIIQKPKWGLDITKNQTNFIRIKESGPSSPEWLFSALKRDGKKPEQEPSVELTR